MSSDESYKEQFLHLVMSLTHSAWIALGKIMNPATQKTEMNLEAAQSAIDLLEMLQAKTKGNVDADEERMLKNTISGLQLNYVEAAKSAPAPQNETVESKDAPPGESPPESKVKFRKSFG